jgi:pimeloyl-ACP methyl ester carboxylesterase
MKLKYFEFPNTEGNLIKGDLRIPFLQSKSALIIFSHGFKGFRNWGFIPYICTEFAKHGYNIINFDFSLNGISDDINQIYDNNLFRKNKVSIEVADLSLLIESIINKNNIFSELYDNWNGEIYLAGHSLGGAVSLLTADKFENVRKVSLWAAVSTLDRNTSRQKEIWKTNGTTEINISSTGQKLNLDYSYIQDKETKFPQNVIIETLRKTNKKIQVIHPRNDLTVSIREAITLHENINNIKKDELIVIEKAGHTFNCRHPFGDTPSEAIQKVVNSTKLFFESKDE